MSVRFKRDNNNLDFSINNNGKKGRRKHIKKKKKLET